MLSVFDSLVHGTVRLSQDEWGQIVGEAVSWVMEEFFLGDIMVGHGRLLFLEAGVNAVVHTVFDELEL